MLALKVGDADKRAHEHNATCENGMSSGLEQVGPCSNIPIWMIISEEH